MKLSSFQEKIENEFDYICKLAIKNERKDYLKHFQRVSSREVTFSELGERTINQFSTLDSIPSNYHTFVIKGVPIQIENTALSKALKKLTSRKREILLLYYFVGMNDPEIASLLDLSVSTVNEHWLTALESLKDYMEDD